jgi:hypothetical protein
MAKVKWQVSYDQRPADAPDDWQPKNWIDVQDASRPIGAVFTRTITDVISPTDEPITSLVVERDRLCEEVVRASGFAAFSID